MNQQPKTVQTIILIAILALVLVVISSSLLTQNSSRLAYSDVLDLFENERVESFVLQGDTLTMTLYASDTAQSKQAQQPPKSATLRHSTRTSTRPLPRRARPAFSSPTTIFPPSTPSGGLSCLISSSASRCCSSGSS